jgi:transposase
MRKPNSIPDERISELETFRKEKWPGDEFRRYLCVWLRTESGMKPDEIAKALGWHTITVRTTQQDFIKRGVAALVECKRGGRNRALMTPEDEKAFLDGFSEQAGAGSILIVTEVHAALELWLNRKIAHSTTYRILKRNGWRKVVPRPFHPKRNPEDAEAFKRGAIQKRSAKPKPGPQQQGSS